MNSIENIKNIKGLIIPKKYRVRNLADYIKYLSKIEPQKYYFRGEGRYYNEILSSGLRNDDNIDYKSNLPFYAMIREYYKEVGQRISDLDRKAFTAFSQHHGIPTNLTDITTSPLIALYFACQDNLDGENTRADKSSVNNTSGFIYAINKQNTIDITERIDKHRDIHVNIIDLLSSEDNEIVKENFKMFNLFFKNNIDLLKYYLYKILDDYKYYEIDGLSSKNGKGFLKKAINGCGIASSRTIYYKSQKKQSIGESEDAKKREIREKYSNKLSDLIIAFENELNIKLSMEDYDYDRMLIYIYYLLVKKFLITTKEYGEYICWFNFIPIFTYNPVTEFQRIKNQQGLFIHQGYRVSHEPCYDCLIFTRQRIWPDKVFIIENKADILKELDNLGINEKFVFYDFDNIAKYIKRNK